MLNKSSNAAATSSVFFVESVVVVCATGWAVSVTVLLGVLGESVCCDVDCGWPLLLPSSVGFNHPSNTDFNSS